MRSESDVRAMKDRLKSTNEALFKQMEALTADGEAFDSHAVAFSSNGCLISALEWVLGENTITYDLPH